MLNEKESKVRESMRIMGMNMRYYYLTWFLRYFIVYAILHAICSGIIIYRCPSIPFYVPYILFLLFDIVIIVQNFFIQVFISRAKLGVVITLVFFIIQYSVLLLISNTTDSKEILHNQLSIIPHVAMYLATRNLLYF